MSRRDTIIVAVLINAGLLAVLFMIAVNPDDHGLNPPVDSQKTIAYAQHLKNPAAAENLSFDEPPTPVDELDKALQDFAMNTPPEPILIDPEFVQEPKKKLTDGAATDYVEITVKRGDSLDKLARTNATTVEAIRRTNQLKNDVLRIGQVLRIPLINSSQKEAAPAQKVIASAPSARPAPTAEPEYYVIKSGDNPWKISKQFKVKFDDLLRLNHLDEDSARALKPGDRIRVQ